MLNDEVIGSDVASFPGHTLPLPYVPGDKASSDDTSDLASSGN